LLDCANVLVKVVANLDQAGCTYSYTRTLRFLLPIS